MVSTIATSSNFGTAIENELNTEVNVITLAVTGNLDAIAEGAQGTMSPARSTVLRNVLVQRVCQIGDAIDGTPGKGIWQVRSLDVLVRERRCDLIELVVTRKELKIWKKKKVSKKSQRFLSDGRRDGAATF